MGQQRKQWVGGNWKCNGTVASVTALCADFKKGDYDPKTVDVVIFPTALHIGVAREKLPPHICVGAQTSSSTPCGAFTGEISVEQIRDFGVRWILAGHSERRQYYGESNQIVAEKLGRILDEGCMHAVLCVGERLEEREAGKTNFVVEEQLEACLSKLSDWSRVVIAYEPVWAIGTGKVATPDQAQEIHQHIRNFVKCKAGADVAEKLRIVYGGSVNSENCTELILQPDVDGFLVGGASLKKSFLEIVSSAAQKDA